MACHPQLHRGVEPVVGLLVTELMVSDALTLKDRRRVVKSLLERLANRHNVSVADMGPDHLPDQAILAVTCVANAEPHVHRVLDAALRLIEAEPHMVCGHVEVAIL